MFAFSLRAQSGRRSIGFDWKRACWVAGGSLGLGLVALVALPADDAAAKTPGSRYCFLGVCHRVKTIAETQALVGKTETVQASFYDDAKRDRFNPRNLTSSGEMFNASRPDNAASPVLPDGTKVMVWSPTTKRAAVIRINNAGPYWGRRMIDLSRGAAEKLGFAHSGVASVQVRVLEAPTPAEATYRRGRVYPPVPGYLGGFASIDDAFTGARIALGGKTGAPVLLAAATWDVPGVRLEAGGVLPPTELGQFAAEATAYPVAEFLVVPATTVVADAKPSPEPSVLMAAAALTSVTAEPVVEPVKVAVAPAPEKRSARKAAPPKTSKPAPTRLAMATVPVPRPAAQRIAAAVNQTAKAAQPRRQPVVLESDGDEPEPQWVPRVLDGTY